MKTKMKMYRWFLVLVLAVSATFAMAENQDPTQTVCVGQQPYHIDPTSLPGVATYTWYLSGGGSILSGNGTTSIIVDWTTAGGPYTLSVFTTLDGCDGPPVNVQVTVIEPIVNPAINVMSPPSPVCDNTPVSATFIAGTGGAGCSDMFEYSYDGSGSWLPYIEGDQITTVGHTLVEIRGKRGGCIPTIGCPEPDWEILATWVITPAIPLIVNITVDVNPICQGATATFTANITSGGGTTPVYQWQLDGADISGANSSTYAYVPADGDVITCVVTSSLSCATGSPATSNAITMNIKPIPTTTGIWHQ